MMKRCLPKQVVFLVLILSVVSVYAGTAAPVVDGWKQNTAEISNYRVQPGDTLYSVAWAFGVDYRDLARYNQLREPYTLTPGQILRMSGPPAVATESAETNSAVVVSAAPAAPEPVAVDNTPTPATHNNNTAKPAASTAAATPVGAPTKAQQQHSNKANPAKTTQTSVASSGPTVTSQTKWRWPTHGRVIRGFSKAPGGNRGIDISGRTGQAVVATNSGKVVYTGASLPGYGNLIIIKHTDNELSAYAFNKVLMVKEGQTVTAGQTIAQMGQNDAGKAMLHFEIRQNGKPVDPMKYFKSR